MIYTPLGFKVFGHFSSIIDDDGEPHVVRSVLEIMTEQTPLDSHPEAICVMMNPGACETNTTSEVTAFPPSCNCVAHPDRTQSRIMELMEHLNWGHVRILNLSDLRNARSSEFYKLLLRFKDPVHSVFHSSRTDELKEYMISKKDAPILKAWGVHKNLISLSKLALKGVPSTALGLRHPKNEVGYYHPLPQTQRQQKQWMHDMLALLRT